MKNKAVSGIILTLLLMSMLLTSFGIRETSATPTVRIYVDMPLGYIPGAPPGDLVLVDLYIDTDIIDDTPDGIVQWAISAQVDPTVLEPMGVLGAAPGYFLYDYLVRSGLSDMGYITGSVLYGVDKAAGKIYWITEAILPTPPTGAGAVPGQMPYKLCTLTFKSLSETAYSPIDLFYEEGVDAWYRTPDGVSHAVDLVEDGHYNAGAPTTLIFEDDFESYVVDTFPYAGGWELWTNGAGNEYQVIVDSVSVSPSKSLQLRGYPSWIATASKRYTTDSVRVGFEVYVRAEESGGARVGFTKRVAPNLIRFYSGVGFGPDGKIALSGHGELEPWVAGEWYKVRQIIDRSNDTCSVWINDVLKASNINIHTNDVPGEYHYNETEAFTLASSYEIVDAYFDDVKIFESAHMHATIFSQNFDEEPTGSVPQGWTVENPDICSLTVNETVYYGDSGKSARYVDSASRKPNGSSYVGRTFEVPFTGQNSVLIAEFSMMAEVPSYFSLYIDDGIVKYHGVNIYFTPYGRLAYVDDFGWHYLCPFSIDTWVRIKMVIDISKNTYDIYVDGVLEAEGAHFRGFGTVTQLSRMLFGGNSFEMPIGYIDEISLYERASNVKVHVDQPLGYIPGVPVGDSFTVDMVIEVSNITDFSSEGIVGWGLSLKVDPDVLNITGAIGAASGYFLWEFADSWSEPYPIQLSNINATAGLADVTEQIIPSPLGGAGDPWSGLKLVTLVFTSKSETAHSLIDLVKVEYMTPDGMWHPVDEIMDGYYNPPPAPDLSVEGIVLPYISMVPLIYPTPDPEFAYKINATVTNQGTADAGSFNVSFSVYLNETEVPEYERKKPISGLAQGASETVGFDFNPENYGNYTLIIEADCDNVVVELDETNNVKMAWVKGTVRGDVDGDGDVDWRDFGDFATDYGKTFEGPPYPSTDFDYDGDADWYDFGTFAQNFGKIV